MVRKMLLTAGVMVMTLYGVLVFSGLGVAYSFEQRPVGPEMGNGARLVGYKLRYFTGFGTFTAVYVRAFGTEDPKFLRKPPSPGERAEAERLLAGVA